MRSLFDRFSNDSRDSVTPDRRTSRPSGATRETQSDGPDVLQYRDVVDFDIFVRDIDLWFAKATLMYAIANAMISDEIDPSVDPTAMDIEETLKSLVLLHDRRTSSNSTSAPQTPFKQTRLFRELMATRIRSDAGEYDRMVQGMVQAVRTDRLADTLTELDASSSTPSRHRDRHGLQTPPSTSRVTRSQTAAAANARTPNTSSNTYSQPAVTPDSSRDSSSPPARTPDNSRDTYNQPTRTPNSSRETYNQPVRTPSVSRNVYSQPARTPSVSQNVYTQPARTPNGYLNVYSQPVSTPSPTPLYPSLAAGTARQYESSPIPVGVGQWVSSTPSVNDDHPVCPGCRNRCEKKITGSGANEGRWYFKCTGDRCRSESFSWQGWSEPGTTSATENRCFCGIPGTGFIGSNRVFRYRCSRGNQGCVSWAYYP